ncbi:hypothetical protein T06_13334 [Trichinella sp. T6]|nr:hypothetical protein T06_13334 [Trichinella sp. T6]
MDIGRARQPYTTLNALWNEWTSGIQQLMCDGLGADGYRWPNNCSNDWLDSASPSIQLRILEGGLRVGCTTPDEW